MNEFFVYSIGLVAPYYNIALVVIVLVLFMKLFSIKSRNVFNKPWVFLFIAVLIFIVEEIVTILMNLGVKTIPHFVFGFFELAMISLFIYMVLLEKEHLIGMDGIKRRHKK